MDGIERVGDPAVRLALRAGRPEPAAQRHDGRRDRRGRLVQGVGRGRHRRTVADADDCTVADRVAQDPGGEPADHPPGQVLGAGHGRGQVDTVEAVSLAERLARGALGRGRVVDPDLDDPLRASALEDARDLRARDAEQLRDGVLRLTELVVQAARADQLLDVAQRRGSAGCTDVSHRCASVIRA